MRLELTGRHVTITAAVRRLVERRLAPTLRILNDHAVSAQVVLTAERARYRAEVTLHARGEHFLHGEAVGRDLPLAVGAALDKIDRQAHRLKSRWSEGKRQRASPRTSGADRGAIEPERAAPSAGRPRRPDGRPRIIRSRGYDVKPMSIEDAAAEIEEARGTVIVFRNSATDSVTVLFRRPDGHLGLIEPDA